MYSKEESKTIREEFWDSFRQLSAKRRTRKRLPGNWMLSQTGIKALNLRFHVDRKVAQVGIDLETKNMEKRIELFEKLEAVKRILEDAMGSPLQWELEYIRENGKSVSRIYLELEGVDIYNRQTWARAHQFMYENMMKLEMFYREYKDFFKYGP
jgi:vacuolar-type H+-ATPase catalytic subunit A/Vma1